MDVSGKRCVEERKRKGNVSAVPNIVAVLRLQRLLVRVLYHLGEEDRLYLYLGDKSVNLSRRAIRLLCQSPPRSAVGGRH